jgi:hypothetical protein
MSINLHPIIPPKNEFLNVLAAKIKKLMISHKYIREFLNV